MLVIISYYKFVYEYRPKKPPKEKQIKEFLFYFIQLKNKLMQDFFFPHTGNCSWKTVLTLFFINSKTSIP